ncbi:MAG TPA: cation diffusion facilitator family transporter [Spirochaetia bacterium]|nr:cation diffusion facilitator family transporter [Spirochaetia bacterium]
MKRRGFQDAQETLAVWMGIVGNAILFAGKILVGFSFDSIAIISDSFNSLTDIVASIIIFISIKSSHEGPDAGHPAGHMRAQPLAGLVVAVLTGIVGFEICAQSVTRLFTGEQIQKGILPIVVLACVLVTKLGMHVYARMTATRTGSPALMAAATDHRNDVLISAAVILGVGASNLGFPIFDPIAAILVGLWIIRAGFGIGRSNIKYLMGEAPPAGLVNDIKARARAVPGVLGLHDVSAHYVGTTVEVALHVDVDRRLSVEDAHDISEKVQGQIEGMEDVSRAFIHIDPMSMAKGRARGAKAKGRRR